MAKLRGIRVCLPLGHDQKLIDDKEVLFLYDINQ